MANTKITPHVLDSTLISGHSTVTAADGDYLLVSDTSDSGALKKVLASDLIQTSEEVQDLIGAMFSSNTETGIAATYQDGDGTIDLVIGDDTIVSSMLDTNIDIAGTFDVTGATTLDSTLAVAGDANFDSGTLFVDVSGNNVGVGATSLQSWAKLEVAGTAGAQTGAKQALYVRAPTTTANEGVGIRMSAASGSNEAVGIIGMVNNASGNSGSMTFHTYNGGADIPEAMRIDNTGNVGIGTASPSVPLHINSTSAVSNRLAIFESDINNTNEYSTISVGHNQLSANLGLMLTTSDTAYIGVGSSGNPFDPTTGTGLYVNANGNVGIGTTSPSGPLEIVDSGSGYDQIKIGHKNGTNENKQGGITTTNYEGNSVSYFQSFNQSGNNGLYIGSADGAHRGWQSIYFYVAENSNTTSGFTKAMQINGNNTVTTGFVGIGSGAVGTNQLQVRSGAANYAAAVFESFTGSGATNYGPYVNLINSPNDGTRYLQRWDSGGSIRAQITSSGHFQSSVNSYGSTSDIKLKENIVDATPKLDDVMKLKVKNFNYIADEDNEKLIGMIAQDVEEVFPGLVFESEDTKTVEGEIKHLGTTTKSLKYSVFVPVLIKAMQEQQTIIEDLKSRIETLEG